MKKLLNIFVATLLMLNFFILSAKSTDQKQIIGVVGAVSGSVKTETRDLNTGDKIFLNEMIISSANSGAQILLLDQSTFTIGAESEVVMDTFVYDPKQNDGVIVANVKKGSLKVISGLISKKNPDNLTVNVPEGTLGSRGTEFQTIVDKKKTQTLLIGPGKDNTLGLRPGAVLVANNKGSTLLNNPYSISIMQKGKAPSQAQKITKNQLKKFNKKMKAVRVAKIDPSTKKELKKEIKQDLKKELKSLGFTKEEVKVLVKQNVKKNKKIKKAKLEDKKNKSNLNNKKDKKKKAKVEKKKPNKKKKKAKLKNKKNKKKKAKVKAKGKSKKKGKVKNKKKNKKKAKKKKDKKKKKKKKKKNNNN